VKTVPVVHLADSSDTAGLPDLPEEVPLVLTGIAGVTGEGLLAMGVAAGLALMQMMSEAEMTGRRAPGKHDRSATRCGTAPDAVPGPSVGGGYRSPQSRYGPDFCQIGADQVQAV
jgi:putative transposase